MNDAQINAKLKAAMPGKYAIGDGLYFRVSKEGSGFFVVRYSINNKRRFPEKALAHTGPNAQRVMSHQD